MKTLEPALISGREVLPLVEGGKGVSVSNGESAGAWARAGCVGTLSCVNADSFDDDGNIVPQVYHGSKRTDRFEELIAYATKGGIAQARIAHEASNGQGRIHMNVLWEAGGTQHILQGVLEEAGDLIHGVTCGAGMPYKVAEITASFGVHYIPIVSSARAFRALWKRSYSKYPEYLGGVVYEDPWLAGGHNGLSNSEDPRSPEPPYDRVRELRKVMNQCGLERTSIFMAGGVWALKEWEDWIGNPELGPVAFQFGTRALITRESPIAEAWKNRLLGLNKGDISLNQFSPTGFYSSAVRNPFLIELEERSARQIPFAREADGEKTDVIPVGPRGTPAYVTPADKARADDWIAAGFTEPLRTPDETLVFVTPEKSAEIRTDQQDCMGCLSQCRFSSWSENGGSTGKPVDPRSFCIQKTLQNIAHGGDVEQNLLFAGHNAYRFASDPFFAGGRVPTVEELIAHIQTGE